MRMVMENIRLVAEKYGRQFSVQNNLAIDEIKADVPMIFRVMGNVTRNAFQYARSKVYISLFWKIICFRLK